MRPLHHLCICLLAAGVALAAPAQPVTNGGFEVLSATGFPADWSPVCGDPANKVEVTGEARSGRRALRMLRTVDGSEVGFNRAWTPSGGEQGSMLSQLKGGLVWHYKAVAAEGAKLQFYVIPMNDEPLEGTGEQRATFEVPEEHVGDGQWHRATVAYDFTDNEEVKWVHVSGRIVGGTGEMLVDDVEYVESVGAIPKILRMELNEKGDGRLAVELRLENAGDEAGDIEIGLDVPEGLEVAGGAVRTLTGMAVGGRQNVVREIRGNREAAGVARLYARAGDNEVVRQIPLQPALAVKALRPETILLPQFGQTNVSCLIENTGHASLQAVSAQLALGAGLVVGDDQPLAREVGAIAPGATATVTWPVKAVAQSVGAQVSAVVSAEGQEQRTVANELVVVGPVHEGVTLPEPTGAVNIAVVQAGAVVENAKIRAEFPRSNAGFGPCRLLVKKGEAWQQVGIIDRLARASHLTSKEQPETLLFSGKVIRDEKQGQPTLTLLSLLRDADGVAWTVRQQWTVAEDADTFSVFTHCYVARPRKLSAFETLMLNAGAGSFGDKKTDALFPGLEWLEGDEVSSSDLDIATDHPDRIRYVPNVNKITIPLMSVHHEGTTVGMLWDANEKWDGKHLARGAVFCSPNYKEGREGHLMGIILPTCPKWLDENTRKAARLYEFTPKGALSLHTHLYLDANAKDSVSAMDKWFELYGVPDSLKPPRGDWQAEIDFSARAYLESLWVPEERGWYSSRGGPKVMESIAPHGHYLYDVLMAERLTKDADLRARLRRLADEVISVAGGTPGADDYGITYGDPMISLDGAAGQVANLLVSQRNDGSWRFDANAPRHGVFEGKDYTELGPHDAAEVGTCARNAYTVLRFARTTGDVRARNAGERALIFMKRFKVPRAAQVWEVPVHTPDILASADACEAYLAGYECTRKPEYLAEAIRWARTGLPFLYVWNMPEYPFMRYGSIPVFGATWFRGSWFGRPVQWNGLRYAYALERLAEYDDSFPWKKVAEGVVVSALYQQSTDADDVALWPDNISCINAQKSGWIFAPRQILSVLYRMLGRDEQPWTRSLSVGDGEIHVSSRGTVSPITANDDTLAFSVQPPPKEACWLLIAGVDEPETIRLNGSVLPKTTGDGVPEEPCYRYRGGHGLLTIRLTTDAQANLLLTGVRAKETVFLPEQVKEIDFSFDESTEGWMSVHDLTPARAQGGKLKAQTTGGDPYLVRSSLSLQGSEDDVIEINMRVSAGEGGTLYWTTRNSPAFAEDKSLRFPLTVGDEMETYRVSVGTHPLWGDQEITAIRIDPGNLAVSAEVEIDSVRRVKLGEGE